MEPKLFRHLPVFLALFLLAACVPSAAQPPLETNTPGEADAQLFPTPIPTRTPRPTATPTGPWNLVWADEFDLPDGSPVDESKWTAVTGGRGWGNNEWQHYTSRVENAYHQGGSLVIHARREDYQGNRYTSARLITKDKGDWTYGRFEVRARVPGGQAIWPAIWMMPTDSVYGIWPKSGEIDIMELIGRAPGTVHGTLHYGSPHEFAGGKYTLPLGQTFADDFHIFAVEWEPGEMRWYVDGYHYFTRSRWFTSTAPDAYPAPFDQRFHLILNVAVGGNWPGPPDETTPEEAQMLVDYVRVYQREE
jgi:beta-glucanase (GH16 family)